MAKAFGDAVKLGRVQFAPPSNGAYGIADGDRRVKIALDGHCAHYARRREYGTANKRPCIENALKWADA